jgi:hypothetical protein
MSRILKLASVALIALTLAGGAAPSLISGTSTLAVMPDPICGEVPPPDCNEDWGVAKKGSFDITEAEGSEELLAAGGTSKGGDTPVVTG